MALSKMARWVRSAAEYAKMGQADLAKALAKQLRRDIDRSVVNKIVLDKRKVSIEEMVAIEEVTGYPAPQEIKKPRNLQTTPGLFLRGEIAAGVWTEVVENQETLLERVPVAPDLRYPTKAQFALRVRGTSIDKIASDGAIITCVDILQGGVVVREGDLVCVERHRGSLIETTVKRLRHGKKVMELWPESNDPAHQTPIPLNSGKDTETVEIKALVVGIYTPIQRGS